MNAPELRLPPHSIEAEQSLLGGLLLDNSAWDRIADKVAESDFYRDAHRRIFRHIARLIEAGKEADVVTVFESLQKTGEAEKADGMAYLGEIANNTPSAANIRRYAEIVAEKRLLRDLLTVGSEICAIAEKPGQEYAVERIDRANGLLFDLAERRPGRAEPRRIGEVLGAVVDDVQERYDSDEPVSGLRTGFADLDAMTCGLQPGDLIIVAGRPSIGKTALAINIAENVALAGRTALVFSFEMGDKQLSTRSLASVGGISVTGMRTGRLTDDDFASMTMALGRLHDAPLFIDESPALTVSQMRARARRVMRKEGLALVVIDYLQLMPGDGKANRNEELAGITRGLKLMARELNVPVVLLSQLSRKVEERTNKRPLMSDLRDSGAIEADADVVLMVYRDDYYHKDSQEKGIAEVIIGKQRMGPTGEVRLVFQGEFSRFRDLAPGDYLHARQEPAVKQARHRGFND